MRLLLKDLSLDTLYELQARIKSDGTPSEWSPKFKFTTVGDSLPPETPINVTWASVGDSFHGEWDKVTHNTNGETSIVVRYEIELTGQPGSVIGYSSVPQATQSPKVSFDFSFEENVARFIAAKATIAIRVRAVDIRGNVSDWSTSVSAGKQPPPAPTGLTGAVNYEYIDLSWNPVSANDLTGYRVYLSTNGGTTYNKVYEGMATAYSFPSAMYTTDHYFQIKAFDKFGQESAASNTYGPVRPKSSFTADTTAPPVPTGLAATITNNTNGVGATAAVSWSQTNTDGDLAGFVLRYRKNGSTDTYLVRMADKDSRAMTIELPLAFTAYELGIRSFDGSGNYSTWATATGAAVANTAPANVTGLSASVGKDSIVYSWTPVTDGDIKNYEVTFSTSSTFASGNTTFYTGTSPNLTVGGLTTGTTYYARVRAVDTGDLTSAAWSATNTSTTGSYPTSNPTDGSAPASSPTPNVQGGLSYLYANWSPVTNNDPVTYEVHLSTTTGFTPAAGTKVTEVSGTFAVIDVLPGTTTPLSYGTTYYVKLIAKDRDGAAAAGAQGSGQISKVASTDVVSIGADLIVPGSGIINNLIINTNGSIQSANYNTTNKTGYKITDTTIDIQGGTVRASALIGDTLGSSTGTIQIGTGAAIVLNGGNLRSNTYNGAGNVYDAAATAGFYLGNDGLVIAQGKVRAEAFAGGTFTAGTITLGTSGVLTVGTGGSVTGTGFTLDSSGLTLSGGSITGAVSLDAGAVKTGSLVSQSTTTINGVAVPTWSIPTNGSATLANLTVRGLTIVGTSGDSGAAGRSTIQSANYNGSVGWKIDANGDAYFASGTFKGNITGATGTFSGNITGSAATVTGTITGNTFQTSSSSTYVVRIDSTNGFRMYGSSSTTPLVDFNISTGNAIFRGDITGASGTFSGSLKSAIIYGGQLITNVDASNNPTGKRVEVGYNGSYDAGQIRIYSGTAGESAGVVDSPGGAALQLSSPTTGTLFTPAQIRLDSGSTTNTQITLGSAITVVNGRMNMSGNIDMQGNNLLTVGTITLSGTGGAINGGVTLNGGPTVNAGITINGGITMGTNPVINGGPTINGSPTWTAPGTGGSANVNWNNGKMQPITSSRRYKENIRDLEVDLDSVYALVPRKYERVTAGTEVGFIAEEALEAGLTDWVVYNDDGEVESFDYFKYVVALQAAVVDLNAKYNDLASRLDNLQ